MTSQTLIEVVRGDITTQAIDAIVNAANSTLLGGGGVDGAIHRAAGPALLEACREVRVEQYPGGLPPGHAVATVGGELPATFVIHTVGPKYWEYPDGGAELLADCHRKCLREAVRVGARTVAFPAISCGAYGWSFTDAAPLAVRAVVEESSVWDEIDMVRFVLFNDDAVTAFTSAAASTST